MGLEMTLQAKGVQIARISALTIRNTLRGANELVCAETWPSGAKSTAAGKTIVKTLVSEGYLEFDKRYKELANPYVPGKEKPRYRHVPYYKLRPRARNWPKRPPSAKWPAEGQSRS